MMRSVEMRAGLTSARGAAWAATAWLGVCVAAPVAFARADGADAVPQPEAPSAGTPTLPGTPAGRRVGAFFEAINAGDPAGYERFNQGNRTAAALARATPERR